MSPIPATVYQFLLFLKAWPIYIAIVAISLAIAFTIRFFIEKTKKIRGKSEIALLHDTVEIFEGSEACRVEDLSGYFQDGKTRSLFKTNIVLSNLANESINVRDLASSDPLRINIEGNKRILALRATASQNEQISLKVDPARGDSIDIIFNSIDPNTCILSKIVHSQRGKIFLFGSINNKPVRYVDLGNFTMKQEDKKIIYLGVGMIAFTKLSDYIEQISKGSNAHWIKHAINIIDILILIPILCTLVYLFLKDGKKARLLRRLKNMRQSAM